MTEYFATVSRRLASVGNVTKSVIAGGIDCDCLWHKYITDIIKIILSKLFLGKLPAMP